MRGLLKNGDRWAATDSTLLILGERRGSAGKEKNLSLAQEFNAHSSPRKTAKAFLLQ